MAKWISIFSFILTAHALNVLAYTVPPGSPGFYHGNSSAAVTFDSHSLFLDNKRLYVFSGEVHPWRLPSGKAAWRDVFQKMKAAGWNAISVYHHWGLSEGKQGNLNFDYYRSHTDVYELAKEVGLLVIARPGPYINAETTGGGFPGWLTNNPAKARTNETGFTNAWMPYITSVAKFIEPYQYPNGPVIAVQSENEFFESTSSDPGRSEHMQLIEDTLRGNGITKIPITHNDANPNGVFSSGLGAVDLYEWDSYPNGFDCSNPSAWGNVASNLNDKHLQIDPDVMWASAEFQGGSFDPWGGSGYDMCFQLLNEQFANVYYKNNYAAQTTLQSLYMTYGGTNWGNLAEPTVYTSYDYGAPIREDRTLSPKYSEIKLQAYFLHASPDFLIATRSGSGTAFSNNTNIYTTVLSSSTGVNFYVVRQATNSITTPTQFSLSVNTTQGIISVPQFGGQIALAGRESKILVANYPFGSSKLEYSTAEVLTWTTIDKIDTIVLYALAGQSIEAVVTGHSRGSPTLHGCSSINATGSNGSVSISGSPSGICVVTFGSTRIIVSDKVTATTFWNPHLLNGQTSFYDVAPDIPSVLVAGPYLVRNATIHGSTLSLNGDLNATTTLDIFAPSSVRSVVWNGQNVRVSPSSIGSLRGSLSFGIKLSLPSLKNVTWACIDSLPEVQAGFDDSTWVLANKTNTSRPYPTLGGKLVLYADEYGFHQGNHIARGHFTGNATGVQLIVQGGFNFGYSAFLNSKFLGSSQGTNQYSAGGGVDMTNVTWSFDPSDLNSGENVVTVVFDQTGLEEDYNGQDTFKTPRGIRGYQLLGADDFSAWRIQGNLGGEDFPDVVRGPLNEGGLYAERIGAHLPGFSTANWTSSSTDSTCSPFAGIDSAGIKAYRTTFNLNIPHGVDIPVALQFERTPSSSYRTLFYVNGWQFGRFSSADGPQTVFPLPEGILNHQGSNELLLTIWSLDADGAKIADAELVNTALIVSSKEAVPVVRSPSFVELRK